MVDKHIKSFCERKNITQAEMAEQLCVTRQAVSSWENGKTEPDIDMLNKIASVLGVSVEELIYGSKSDTNVVHNHNTIQIYHKEYYKRFIFWFGTGYDYFVC